MKQETKKLLWIGLIVLIIIGGGVLAYNGTQTAIKNTPSADPKLLMNAGSHSTAQGSRTYPVTIVEFGDYQCPACGFAEPIVEKILQNDPEVNLVFRNFPLPMHQNAVIAAKTAEAADAQGKFWEMHNAIYLNQDIWSTMQNPMDAFVVIGKKLNIDTDKLQLDVKSTKYTDIISKDQADGDALNINSTPTFFINGKQYTGGLEYNALQDAITTAYTASTQQTTSQQ